MCVWVWLFQRNPRCRHLHRLGCSWVLKRTRDLVKYNLLFSEGSVSLVGFSADTMVTGGSVGKLSTIARRFGGDWVARTPDV